jgi:hypothetical protein
MLVGAEIHSPAAARGQRAPCVAALVIGDGSGVGERVQQRERAEGGDPGAVRGAADPAVVAVDRALLVHAWEQRLDQRAPRQRRVLVLDELGEARLRVRAGAGADVQPGGQAMHTAAQFVLTAIAT